MTSSARRLIIVIAGLDPGMTIEMVVA